MQPYFFPYLGYLQLIQHTDKWIVFDSIQFSSKSWVNRNRILHPEQSKDWQYVTIPLKKHSNLSQINEIDINNNITWQKQILGKLTHYKKIAPFYNQTIEIVKESILPSHTKLNNVLVNSLVNTCDYLEIDFQYSLFSEMNFDDSIITSPGDWALNIAKAHHASEYVNPPSGFKIFNEEAFIKNNIQLSFLTSDLPTYSQSRSPFSVGLSIIDIMMWNSPHDIKLMLNKYRINSYKELNQQAIVK